MASFALANVVPPGFAMPARALLRRGVFALDTRGAVGVLLDRRLIVLASAEPTRLVTLGVRRFLRATDQCQRHGEQRTANNVLEQILSHTLDLEKGVWDINARH